MLHAKYSCVALSFRKPDVVDVPDAEEVVTDTLEKIEKIAILRSFYAAVLPEAKFNEQIETILDTLEQRQPSLFSSVVEWQLLLEKLGAKYSCEVMSCRKDAPQSTEVAVDVLDVEEDIPENSP